MKYNPLCSIRFIDSFQIVQKAPCMRKMSYNTEYFLGEDFASSSFFNDHDIICLKTVNNSCLKAEKLYCPFKERRHSGGLHRRLVYRQIGQASE
ncbi:MAG: hypothetical protein K2X69_16245, partial [Silvanigrellaceae bacterium]|nr:hypothetical protein [Silvanigrellaceae bacterium]